MDEAYRESERGLRIFTGRIDAAIRLFLYVLIFWLPYSPAVIESCVVTALVLWLVKRTTLFLREVKTGKGIWQKGKIFLKAFKPQESILNQPIAFFLFVCVVSLFGSFYVEQSVHGFLTKTVEWFIVYFLVAEVFTERRHVMGALVIFLITSLATAFDGLIQFHLTGKDIFMGRVIPRADPFARSGATAAFKHANILGAYLTFAVPVMIAVFFCFSKRYLKFLSLLTVGVSLWLLVITFSRGAWLAVTTGLLFLAGLMKREIFFTGLGVLGLLILSAVLFLSPQTKSFCRMTTDSLNNSLRYRLGLWEDSLKMIQDKPVFGHGLNTFMPLFQEYRRKYQGQFDFGPTYAHNSFIQIAVETGLVGLTGFGWIFLRLFRKVIDQMRQTSHHNSFRILPASLLAGVFGFLVQSGVDTNFYSLQPSVLFWLMMGILNCPSRPVADGR